MTDATNSGSDADRSRGVEDAPEESQRRNPQLVGKARDVVKCLVLLVKNRALLGLAHPQIRLLERGFATQLQQYFEMVDELDLQLHPLGAQFGRQPILTVERPQHSPFFALLQDGVREVKIGSGVTSDELDAFLEALIVHEESSIEDSAMTALWEVDLRHIELVQTDPFSGDDDDEAGGGGGSSRRNEFKDLLSEALSDSLPDDGEAELQCRSSFALTESELFGPRAAAELKDLVRPERARKRAETHTMSDGELAELKAAVEGCARRGKQAMGLPPDMDRRFVRSVMEAVPANAPPRERSAARDALVPVALEAFSIGDIKTGQRILRKAAKVTGKRGTDGLFPAEMHDDLVWIADVILADETLSAEASREFWAVLPPQVHEAIFERLFESGDLKMFKHVALLGDGPSAKVKSMLVAAVSGEDTKRARTVLPLAADFAKEDLAESLMAAVDGEDQGLGFAALEALTKIDPAKAVQRAGPWLVHEDIARRDMAREILEGAGLHQEVLPHYEAVFDSSAFKTADIAEKRTMYVSVGRAAGRTGLALVREAATRGGMLAGRESHELRAAAILALGLLADTTSRGLIEKASKGWRVPAVVSAACQNALQAIRKSKGSPT